MAPSPQSPYTSLLLLSLLLFLLSFSHAERVTATVRNLQAEVDAGDEEAAGFSAATTDNEHCSGDGAGEGEGDDDYLMRRTLVAHTDYIYTQGGSHN